MFNPMLLTWSFLVEYMACLFLSVFNESTRLLDKCKDNIAIALFDRWVPDY